MDIKKCLGTKLWLTSVSDDQELKERFWGCLLVRTPLYWNHIMAFFVSAHQKISGRFQGFNQEFKTDFRVAYWWELHHLPPLLTPHITPGVIIVTNLQLTKEREILWQSFWNFFLPSVDIRLVILQMAGHCWVCLWLVANYFGSYFTQQRCLDSIVVSVFVDFFVEFDKYRIKYKFRIRSKSDGETSRLVFCCHLFWVPDKVSQFRPRLSNSSENHKTMKKSLFLVKHTLTCPLWCWCCFLWASLLSCRNKH